MKTFDLQEEKSIVDAAKADLRNFNVLYEKYVKDIYNYCFYRVNCNKELAEDITSQTFTKAIEHFDKYNFQNKPFITWLYQIAHNLIIDHYRKKSSKNVNLSELVYEPAAESTDIIEKLSHEELVDEVKGAAKDLPDEVLNIFTLRYNQELTFAQIADVEGKTEGAVKMQHYRGMKQLRQLIAERRGKVTNGEVKR